MCSVPLLLLLRWCLPHTLFLLYEISIPTFVQTNDTLDEIMIWGFFVRFWSFLYPQLSVKDEIRLCHSALDESLEYKLIQKGLSSNSTTFMVSWWWWCSKWGLECFVLTVIWFDLDTFVLLVLVRKEKIVFEVDIQSGAFEELLAIIATENCHQSKM